MKNVLIAVLFLVSNTANAFSFVVNPDPAPYDQSQSTVNATCPGTTVTTGENWIMYDPNGDVFIWDWCSNGGYDPGYLNDWLWYPAIEGTYTIRTYGTSEDYEAWWQGDYETNPPDINTATYTSTFCYVQCSEQNNIWGSNNGFWGSTTPAAFVGDMTASVQSTGDNVYPLLVFVGIPLGFAIAGYLIYQIKRTLEPVPGNEYITPVDNLDDIVYHSASDLEFKRNYGQKRNKEPRV